MHFVKMEGCGNDYIYVDCFKEAVADPSGLAKRLSDRHFGIGADGLILIAPSKTADARMIMYNADGGEAEMCGNGIRCLAKYVYESGIRRQKTLKIETLAGIKEISLAVERGRAVAAQVNMGLPYLAGPDIPVALDRNPVFNEPLEAGGRKFLFTAVGMGNPHCVIYVDAVAGLDVAGLGPAIERHPLFPKKTNVEFVQVVSKTEVIQRTWERGSGETLACGTGACAVCVAGVLTGKSGPAVKSRLRGGVLSLEWPSRGAPVSMTGPCVEIFRGTVEQ
jgi:diaminopimelate epimerase